MLGTEGYKTSLHLLFTPSVPSTVESTLYRQSTVQNTSLERSVHYYSEEETETWRG